MTGLLMATLMVPGACVAIALALNAAIRVVRAARYLLDEQSRRPRLVANDAPIATARAHRPVAQAALRQAA